MYSMSALIEPDFIEFVRAIPIFRDSELILESKDFIVQFLVVFWSWLIGEKCFEFTNFSF